MKKNHILFFTIFVFFFFLFSCNKDEFMVYLHPNGGSGEMTTQIFSQKKAQAIIDNPFTYNGFIFQGWNTAPEGTGKAYKDKETILITEDKVLYAQWILESGNIIVTFKPNGGAGDMLPQEFEAGVPQALSANAFINEMYKFIEWNTSADGKGKKIINKQIITIYAAITLYAQWEPLFKTISYNANGGMGTMEQQKFLENEHKELLSNKFSREDYCFTGWNTKADGSGRSFRDREKTMIYENLVLYAQWARNPEPCSAFPIVKDIDGNTYNTVQIGAQCWMKENLKTTKYNTGENLPIGSTWGEYGAMCYYEDDVNNAVIYGALYNQYAVITKKLCPEGWKIPDDKEWEQLTNYLGESNAGYKMKTEYGWNDDWYYGNGNGTNESGFSALPAGTRYSWLSDKFSGKGTETQFWSSSTDWTYIYTWSLSNSSSGLGFNWGIHNSAFSIRCIKD